MSFWQVPIILSIFLLSGTKRYSRFILCFPSCVGPRICHSHPHGVWYLETRNRALDILIVPSVSLLLGSLSRCKEIYVCTHTFTYTFTHTFVCMYVCISIYWKPWVHTNTSKYNPLSSLFLPLPFLSCKFFLWQLQIPSVYLLLCLFRCNQPCSHLLALTLLGLSPRGSNLLGKLHLR